METMITEPSSRARRTKVIVAVLAVTLAIVVAVRPTRTAPFAASGTARPTPPAEALTPLSADDFEGVLVGLRGTPVIVNIWASWCAPCRTETPLLQRAWEQHADEVMILGVDSKDTVGAAEGFMDDFAVTYPNVFDATGEIRARLGLRGFPTTYVFDAEGNLVTSIVGGLTEQRLAGIIQDIS